MVKVSSDWIVERSWAWAAAGSAGLGSGCDAACSGAAGSAVVPVVPAVGQAGAGGVAAKEEDEDVVEEAAVVAVREVLEHALEHDDPGEGLENEPEIRQRLRAFHIV